VFSVQRPSVLVFEFDGNPYVVDHRGMDTVSVPTGAGRAALWPLKYLTLMNRWRQYGNSAVRDDEIQQVVFAILGTCLQPPTALGNARKALADAASPDLSGAAGCCLAIHGASEWFC
jgi:hypothetical protein